MCLFFPCDNNVQTPQTETDGGAVGVATESATSGVDVILSVTATATATATALTAAAAAALAAFVTM